MILAANRITVRLGDRIILQDVGLQVEPGELVVVAGANGAGKSTALRCLAGLLEPTAGEVTVDGVRLMDQDRRQVARKIAYLPQERTVHWSMACRDIVALGRLPHRSFGAALAEADLVAVDDALRRLDVAQFAQRPIATLSGGERARVLVARALAQQARYIITDEPTAGLDPAHSLRLFEEFKRLAQAGHGIVSALHDLSLAARYATRVFLLKDGICIANGPPAEVLSRSNLATAFAVDSVIAECGGFPIVLPVTPLT